MKKTLVVIAAFVTIAALAAPTFAAKSKGSGSTVVTSSIALDTVTNGDGTTVKVASGSLQPSLGNTVTFATTVEPIAGWQYAMVDLSCYQDVNLDGVVDSSTVLSKDVVFTQLAKPDAFYTLGGASSIWTLRGGGDATCRADLYAIGWKGGRESARLLATTHDWTAAG